jgi:hypothetical protein
MLVVTAAPALAAPQPNGFNGGGDTVTVTATFVNAATYYVEFQPAGTCTTAPAFAGTPSTAATATGTTSLDVKVPPAVKLTSTRTLTYQICIWDITALSTLVDGATTYTANIFDLVLDTGMTAGPNNGGNVITAKTLLPSGSTPVAVLPPSAGYPAQFQVEAGSSACAPTYVIGNGPTVTASNTASTAGSTLSLTVPTGASGTFPTTVPKVTAAAPAADYNICVYNGTLASSVLIAGTDRGSIAPYRVSIFSLTPLTLSSGPSGGGNTVVATMPAIGLTPGAYYTQFQVGTACADTAAASSTRDTTATAGSTTLSVPVPAGVDGDPASAYRICVYAGTSGSPGGLLAQSTAYTIAAYGLALSTYATGQNSTNVIVTATLSGGTLSATASVQFYVAAPCAATYSTPAGSGTTGPFDGGLTPISPTKAAIAVPPLVTANKFNYTVCIYTGTGNGSSALIAAAATPYIVGTTVAITAVDVNAGPSQGGATITLTGTFPASPAALSVTIGGLEATVTTRTSTTAVTATVPAHTPGTFPIVVTTAAGPVINSAISFTYSYGISVTPQSAPSLPVATAVDVRGVGFLSLLFADTTGGVNQNSDKPHVYLVKGSYNAVSTGTPAVKTNGQTAECVAVRVVSDTELVCSLYLGGNPAGYARSLAGCTVTVAATTLTVCAASAADVGFYVTAVTGTGSGPTIAPGTAISAVNGTTATLSKAVGGSTGPITLAAVTLNSERDVTDVTATTTTTSGTPVTTLATTTTPAVGTFTAGDVGHAVSGPGIPAGTTISTVSAGGVATLSGPGTTSAATVKVYLQTYNAASTGTYTITIVSNGSVGATKEVANASIISSGSTFTVADYRRR